MEKKNIITKIVDSTIDTIKRFYFPIFASLFSSFIAILLIETDFSEKTILQLSYLLHVSILSIPTFIAVTIFGEQQKLSTVIKLGLNFLFLFLLILYYFLLPEQFSNKVVYRGILLTIAIHLIVSYLPFLIKGDHYNFWEYNRRVFERVVITAVYSIVVYGGVSIAMVASDELFNLNIPEEIYLEYWILVVGIFATILFLAGFPKNFNNENLETTYPVGLKIFTQFILLPLVTLYFLILYGYIAKILITWEIPQGLTSYLVIIFSIVGIFALLLIYPVQYSTKSKWIRIYSKIFYWAILPLIGLLLISIFKRINQYGITENRYFILALGVWLAGISIYLLINKLENIKIIPISLSVIALLTAFGPWGAFNISKMSQLRIIKQKLEEINVLVDGQINKNHETIDWEEENKIHQKIDYIVENHGYKNIQKIIDIELDTSFTNTASSYNITNAIADSLGINGDSYSQTTNGNNFYYTLKYEYTNDKAKKTTDYDFFVDMDIYNYEEIIEKEIEFDTTSMFFEINEKLIINYNETIEEYDFLSFIKRLEKKYGETNYEISSTDFIIFVENEEYKCKFELKSIDGSYDENNLLEVSSLTADFFIKLK